MKLLTNTTSSVGKGRKDIESEKITRDGYSAMVANL